MTKLKKNDRVEITAYPDSSYNGFFGKVLEPLDQYGYVELALESVPVGYSEEWQAGSFYVLPHEITLAKQETKVAEFQKGDVVRLTRSRNFYGYEFDGWGNRCGFEVGSVQELDGINPNCTKAGEFVGWDVVGGGWVRSDDIELVSRKEEFLTVELTSEMIDWEEALFGEHATDEHGANYKIERVEEDLVSIKVKKSIVWSSEDLIELGSHILALAEYLETGTVDLSDDCIECENEHLRDSNERLASANEAKRQRLAKIRELTEV